MTMHGKTFIVAFVAMLSAGNLAQLRAAPNGLSAEIQGVARYEGPTPPSGYQHVLAVSAKQETGQLGGEPCEGALPLRAKGELLNLTCWSTPLRTS